MLNVRVSQKNQTRKLPVKVFTKKMSANFPQKFLPIFSQKNSAVVTGKNCGIPQKKTQTVRLSYTTAVSLIIWSTVAR